MSKVFFIVKIFLIIPFILISLSINGHVAARAEEQPIIITSQTLTADNRNNTVIFEGSVVAKSDDITMYSDRMVVSYNNDYGEITKIHSYGNVRVHKKDRAIFSHEATYLSEEEKFIFTGNPKVVEKDNVITGTQIIYFLKDDRAVVEGSRVVLKKPDNKNNAFPQN